MRYHYKITQRGSIHFEKVFKLGSIFFYVFMYVIIYIILYIQDLHMNNKIEQRVSGIYKIRTYSSVIWWWCCFRLGRLPRETNKLWKRHSWYRVYKMAINSLHFLKEYLIFFTHIFHWNNAEFACVIKA